MRTPQQLAALQRALEDTQTAWGSSRWGTYRRCQQQHHLRYIVGLERVTEGPREEYFDIGSLCHAVLRWVQDGVMAGESRNWEDVLDYASETGKYPPWPLDEAHRLMRWYWDRWGVENAGWEDARIVAVEQKAVWEGGVLPHTGRTDTILEIAGELVVVDTKTRGTDLPGYRNDEIADEEKYNEYKRGLATRPQFVSLSAAVQAARGLDVPPHVLVNYIVKTKVPKFRRVVVLISQANVDRWKEVHAEWALALNHNASDPPRVPLQNWSECAPEIGRPCYYMSYCHGSNEQRQLGWTAKGPRVIGGEE